MWARLRPSRQKNSLILGLLTGLLAVRVPVRELTVRERADHGEPDDDLGTEAELHVQRRPRLDVGGGAQVHRAGGVEDGEDLLVPGTVVVQATDTYRVPFADLATQQAQLFVATARGGGHFSDDGIVLEVQGVSRPNSTNTGNVVTPSNVPRGAAIALVKLVPTFDGNGHLQDSIVSSVDVSGDGASVQTRQWIADHITSTGPLGDLILQSGQGVTDVTGPSLFGSLLANGPITGTVQTTGQRTDPITGGTSAVPADLGRLYVDTSTPNPVLTTTLVQSRGPGLSGRLIVRGNLISQVLADGGVSGLIAVQGSILETTALSADGNHQVRLGGVVSNGHFRGQLVVLGSVLGDVVLHGGLKNGARIAVKGDVLGNMTVDGGIDAASALLGGLGGVQRAGLEHGFCYRCHSAHRVDRAVEYQRFLRKVVQFQRCVDQPIEHLKERTVRTVPASEDHTPAIINRFECGIDQSEDSGFLAAVFH
jgi:hypothetical protein